MRVVIVEGEGAVLGVNLDSAISALFLRANLRFYATDGWKA